MTKRKTSKVDQQNERIKSVFNSTEIPRVTVKTLQQYFEHLKATLACPCLLTGIESMGFFQWEARFSFGYGDEQEYEQLRHKHGSFRDKYELSDLNDGEVNWRNLWVNVRRIPRRKRFVIPLAELHAVDENSGNFQLLNDYTVWYVNWH